MKNKAIQKAIDIEGAKKLADLCGVSQLTRGALYDGDHDE